MSRRSEEVIALAQFGPSEDQPPPSYREIQPSRVPVPPPGVSVDPQQGRNRGHAPGFQPVVTAQPRRVLFDESSMSVLHRMQRSNQYAVPQLNNMVGSMTANLETRAVQDISRIPNDLDYGFMISNLLLPEEEILTDDTAQLLHAEILTRNEEGIVQSKLPRGRTLLTNKRLLFLSSSASQESGLAPDTVRGSYQMYTLSVTATNSVVFIPIPLGSIKCVMLSSEVSSKWSTSIKGLLSCTSLCGQSDHVSQWSYEQPINLVKNVRMVRVGVTLPPFDKPVLVDIRLEHNFSLQTATEFVGKVQALIA